MLSLLYALLTTMFLASLCMASSSGQKAPKIDLNPLVDLTGKAYATDASIVKMASVQFKDKTVEGLRTALLDTYQKVSTQKSALEDEMKKAFDLAAKKALTEHDKKDEKDSKEADKKQEKSSASPSASASSSSSSSSSSSTSSSISSASTAPLVDPKIPTAIKAMGGYLAKLNGVGAQLYAQASLFDVVSGFADALGHSVSEIDLKSLDGIIDASLDGQALFVGDCSVVGPHLFVASSTLYGKPDRNIEVVHTNDKNVSKWKIWNGGLGGGRGFSYDSVVVADTHIRFADGSLLIFDGDNGQSEGIEKVLVQHAVAANEIAHILLRDKVAQKQFKVDKNAMIAFSSTIKGCVEALQKMSERDGFDGAKAVVYANLVAEIEVAKKQLAALLGTLSTSIQVTVKEIESGLSG